jgi:hypothetical protein
LFKAVPLYSSNHSISFIIPQYTLSLFKAGQFEFLPLSKGTVFVQNQAIIQAM